MKGVMKGGKGWNVICCCVVNISRHTYLCDSCLLARCSLPSLRKKARCVNLKQRPLPMRLNAFRFIARKILYGPYSAFSFSHEVLTDSPCKFAAVALSDHRSIVMYRELEVEEKKKATSMRSPFIFFFFFFWLLGASYWL